MLASLHNLPLDSEPVQRQRQEILDTIAMESSHAKINVLDLLWDRSKLKTGRRLRVAFLILAIQQNMGQYIVLRSCNSTDNLIQVSTCSYILQPPS